MRMAIGVVVICLMSSQAMAMVMYQDGGTYDIATTINGDVWVDWASPAMGTTVNVLSGGSIYQLQGFHDSIVTMSGGSVQDLRVHDNSQFTMSNGTVSDYLAAYNSNTVTISGGSVNSLTAYESSTVTISGGSVGSGPYDYLAAANSSTVTISGGSVSAVHANQSSTVTISGGSVSALYTYDSSTVTISGGTIGTDLRLNDSVELLICGSDFAIDGISFGYGSISSMLGGVYSDEAYRTLTGTLVDGSSIDNQFRIGNTAQIVLIPEPTTLLLLGLGGLMLGRKR